MILRLTNWAENVARLAIVGLFFSLFFSRSLFVLCGFLALIGCLLSGRYWARFRLIASNPATALMLAFLVYIGVSAALTFAGSNTVAALKVYWQLLLIPVIATTMTRDGDVARCWGAYAAGASVLLAHIVLMPWYQPAWISSSNPSMVFFNPLPQAVALAIFAGWCVYRVLEINQRFAGRLLLVLGFVASSWAVLFVSQQRLGFLSWAVMVGSGCVLQVPKHWRWKMAIFVTIALCTILLANDAIRERMLLGFYEFQSYDDKASFSSIGARLYFWATAWNSIQQAPWFGHGTGSYRGVIEHAFNDASMCNIGCMHPHQQYLMFWLEFGVAGLLLFVGMLASIAAYHVCNPRLHSLALPVLLVFCLSGLVDTPLWYRGFLYLFVPLLGLLAVRFTQGPGDLLRVNQLRHSSFSNA